MRWKVFLALGVITIIAVMLTIYYPYYLYKDYPSTKVLITDGYSDLNGDWHASGMLLDTAEIVPLTNVNAKHNRGAVISVAMVGDCL